MLAGGPLEIEDMTTEGVYERIQYRAKDIRYLQAELRKKTKELSKIKKPNVRDEDLLVWIEAIAIPVLNSAAIVLEKMKRGY